MSELKMIDEVFKIGEDAEEFTDEQFCIKPRECEECISDFEYEEMEYHLDFFVENDINYCTYCGAVLNV